MRGTNAILIGGLRANPWVDLFTPFTHMRVDYDWRSRSNFVHNLTPAPGESAQYEETAKGDQNIAYGVIAYVPSLDREGVTLLVGGTSKAGTEAAADYLFSQGFYKLLAKNSSKEQMPYFALILSTRDLDGDAHQNEVICFHRLID